MRWTVGTLWRGSVIVTRRAGRATKSKSAHPVRERRTLGGRGGGAPRQPPCGHGGYAGLSSLARVKPALGRLRNTSQGTARSSVHRAVARTLFGFLAAGLMDGKSDGD